MAPGKRLVRFPVWPARTPRAPQHVDGRPLPFSMRTSPAAPAAAKWPPRQGRIDAGCAENASWGEGRRRRRDPARPRRLQSPVSCRLGCRRAPWLVGEALLITTRRRALGPEDDGAACVAVYRLGECCGGIGEVVGGGDRNRQLAVGELVCQLAQLVSVWADIDVGDRDATLLGGRIRCDRGQPPVVRDCANGVGGIAGNRVDCGGHAPALGDRANLFGP